MRARSVASAAGGAAEGIGGTVRELSSEVGMLRGRPFGLLRLPAQEVIGFPLEMESTCLKPVQSATIESYVSLLKGYLLFSYDFETPAQSPRLSRLIALVRTQK